MADAGVIEIIDLENNQRSNFHNPLSHTSRGRNKRDAITVETYSSSSSSSSSNKQFHKSTTGIINIPDEDSDATAISDDEIQIIKSFRYEQGQSSYSRSSKKPKTFDCEICAEPKRKHESFNIKGCNHSYCKECMSRYVASKIQENVIVITCPETNCVGVLELEFCREILPREVFDRWGNALCESLILGAEKFYCPFKDCSALLIDDGGVKVMESECPHCRRMFCAQCKVPWHFGIVCEEFQKLGKGEREREDIMLMKLAKDKSWQRCPKCKIYVERIEGCLFMKCRCGYTFCYSCAAPMDPRNHNCTKCRR